MKQLKLLLILSPILIKANYDNMDINQPLPLTPNQILFQKNMVEMVERKLDRMQEPTQQELDAFLFSNIAYLSIDSIKKLIAKGANPNAGFQGITILEKAIILSKDPNIIKTLIDLGANPNAQSISLGKNYLIHSAVRIKSPEILNVLIDSGANLEAQNGFLETALGIAVSKNKPEFVQILLDAGANVNHQDMYGNTPLHKAVKVNNPDLVNMLLNAHADKTILNNAYLTDLLLHRYWGRTPLEIAKSQKNPNPKIIKLLEEPSWFSWFYN